MAAIAPHMQRAWSHLSRELAIAMGAMQNASSNVQYAASLLGTKRGKKG